MPWFWLIPVVLLVAIIGLFFALRGLKYFGGLVGQERARELFRLQRERLEAQFITTAAATGKPRGLRWIDCQWENGVEFARDRNNGQIAALVGVTIQFEAVEGGDMEGLPAVGNLRNASAVFYFHKGHWGTVGRAVFNMNPSEALDHFKNQYERMG